MANYELTNEADEDLKNIAFYTVSNWGSRQVARYRALLSDHFEAIGSGKARTRVFLQRRPELRVSRIEHHYVFHLERVGRGPLILGVFHENMDLMTRLKDRLRD